MPSEVFAEFGEGWLSHAALDTETVSLAAFTSNVPETLLTAYGQHDPTKIDYLASHCLTGETATLIASTDDITTPDRRILNGILARFGVFGVISQPVPVSNLAASVTWTANSAEAFAKVTRPAALERFRLASLLFNAAFDPGRSSLRRSARVNYARAFLLSPREHEALTLLAQGHRTARIAGEMGVSEAAVKKFHALARGKLGAKTMTQAVAIAA